jgi:hypothetical protein
MTWPKTFADRANVRVGSGRFISKAPSRRTRRSPPQRLVAFHWRLSICRWVVRWREHATESRIEKAFDKIAPRDLPNLSTISATDIVPASDRNFVTSAFVHLGDGSLVICRSAALKMAALHSQISFHDGCSTLSHHD